MSNGKTVKIVFFGTPTEREGGNFEKGKTYEMSATSAARWIRRNRAMTLEDYKTKIKADDKK